MLKYIFEDILLEKIKEDLSLKLTEEEHKCTLVVHDVIPTFENPKATNTYEGSIFVERLHPINGQNKYIDIAFEVVVDLNNDKNTKCSVKIEYEYKD